jgi:hypothetical protein
VTDREIDNRRHDIPSDVDALDQVHGSPPLADDVAGFDHGPSSVLQARRNDSAGLREGFAGFLERLPPRCSARFGSVQRQEELRAP